MHSTCYLGYGFFAQVCVFFYLMTYLGCLNLWDFFWTFFRSLILLNFFFRGVLIYTRFSSFFFFLGKGRGDDRPWWEGSFGSGYPKYIQRRILLVLHVFPIFTCFFLFLVFFSLSTVLYLFNWTFSYLYFSLGWWSGVGWSIFYIERGTKIGPGISILGVFFGSSFFKTLAK